MHSTTASCSCPASLFIFTFLQRLAASKPPLDWVKQRPCSYGFILPVYADDGTLRNRTVVKRFSSSENGLNFLMYICWWCWSSVLRMPLDSKLAKCSTCDQFYPSTVFFRVIMALVFQVLHLTYCGRHRTKLRPLDV